MALSLPATCHVAARGLRRQSTVTADASFGAPTVTFCPRHVAQRTESSLHGLLQTQGRRSWCPCAASSSASSSQDGSGDYVTAGNTNDASGQTTPPQKAPQGAAMRLLQLAMLAIGAASLLAAGTTVASGGPAALIAAFTKSGFTAAFSLIFVSEIGDKTFFIAALLAMRHSRIMVLAGASTALALMSVISVVIGRLFRQLPSQLQTSLPVGEYAAVALLVWFGVRSIRSALALPTAAVDHAVSEEEGSGGELAEAEQFLSNVEEDRLATNFGVFTEAFSLVFVAEWGDRSMLATIALGAAQSPVGVALGASVGHVLATGIAVMGGSLLAEHISERAVGLLGGILFLVFAVATLCGVF